MGAIVAAYVEEGSHDSNGRKKLEGGSNRQTMEKRSETVVENVRKEWNWTAIDNFGRKWSETVIED